MTQSSSRFDRILSKQRPLWQKLLVSLIFLLLPFIAAAFDGVLYEYLLLGRWRFFLLAPSIILYIWFVSPAMARSEVDVIRSIRPLIPMDDKEFSQMVRRESQVNPRYEWLSFGIGALLGIISALTSGMDQNVSSLLFYWFFSMAIMYGLLGWVIFAAIASTRFNAALHSQPLQFDILDPEPFEVVGRQSLLMALVFIGGITLSLLLTFQLENISSPALWLSYLLLVLITLLIFFLNMRPTHQILVTARQGELKPLQQKINTLCRELMLRLDTKQDAGSIPEEINALVAYESRLLSARTWPYNTSMLRTLFFSVLIPIGSVVTRLLFEILFG